jgi:hypothetical protein
MNSVAIYVDREDARKVEEEERDAFIKGVLESIGIPLDDVWPGKRLANVEQKMDFQKRMEEFELDILDDGDHGVKIYVGEDLIAEWLRPQFVLRTDRKARHPSKRLFYEMTIRFWSMFDEGDEDD